MAVPTASAYAAFVLDIDNLETNAVRAEAIVERLRQSVASGITAKMSLAGLRDPGATAQGQAASAGAANIQASAKASAQQAQNSTAAATALDKETAARIRGLNSLGQWAKALELIEPLEKQFAADSREGILLAQQRAKAEGQRAKENIANAQILAAQALKEGDLAAAIKQQQIVVDNTANGTRARVTAMNRLIALEKQQEEALRRNAIAELQQARATGATTAELEKLAAAERARAQSSGIDTGRHDARLQKEVGGGAQDATRDARALQNAHIEGARAALNYEKAIEELDAAVVDAGDDQVRVAQLEARRIQIMRQLSNALAQATDEESKAAKASRETQRALDANRAAQANASLIMPAGRQLDTRMADLEREEATLIARLRTEKQAEADASIKASIAGRAYAEAITKINEQLAIAGNSAKRNSQLQAELATATLAQEKAIDSYAVKMANAEARSNDFQKAEARLQKIIDSLLPGERRRVELEEKLSSIRDKATAKAKAYNEQLIKEIELEGDLSKAADAVGKLAQQTQDPTQKLALLNKEKQLRQQLTDEQRKQALAAADLQKQLGNQSGELDELNRALGLAKAGTKEHTEIQTRLVQATKQATREEQLNADAAIRAAKSSRDYATAIKLINEQLALAIPNSTRFHNLTAQLATTQRQAAGAWGQVIGTLKQLVGPITVATLAWKGLKETMDNIAEGTRLNAELQQSERSLAALFNSQLRANVTMRESIAFGRQYGLTMKEMGEAAQEAGILMQTSSASAKETLEVLGRLQTRAPGKGFNDAVRSIAELQSGQLQSIQRVFNIPAKFAQEMRDAIESGIDPIEAVDQVLNKLGQTAGVLQARNQGLSKSITDVGLGFERYKSSLAKLVEGPADRFLKWTAMALEGINKVQEGMAGLDKTDAKDFASGFQAAFKDFQQSGSGQNINPFAALIDVAARSLLTFGAAGESARIRTVKNMEEMTFSVDELRKHAEAAIPALRDAAPDPDKPKTYAEELENVNSRTNALINLYNQQGAATDKIAASFDKLEISGKRIQAEDTLNVVKNIKRDFPETEIQLAVLQQRLIQFQALGDKNPKLAASYIPQIKAIFNEIKALEALSPIDITVQLRLVQIGAVADIAGNMRQAMSKLNSDLIAEQESYYDKVASISIEAGERETAYQADRAAMVTKYETDVLTTTVNFATERSKIVSRQAQEALDAEIEFGEQRVAAAQQFAAQIGALEVNYGRARSRAIRDFGRQMASAEADFGLQRQKTLDDYGRQMARAEREYGAQRARSIRDFGRQMERSERDYNQSRAAALADHVRQLARSERDYRQGLARTARDFQRQNERADRDFQRSEARTLDDFNRQRAEAIKDAQKDEERSTQDHLKSLARMQRDYEVDRQRATEDFELERATLLAEGRVAEAQVLQSRFTVEQRRAAEDNARARSDAGDEFSQGNKDRKTALEEQLARAQEEFDRAREQRKADFELQRQDAQQAYDWQLADAAEARAQQLADEKEDWERQRAQEAAQHEQQRADAKQAFDWQQEDAAAAYEQMKEDAAAALALQLAEAEAAYGRQVAAAKQAFAWQQADAEEAYNLQKLEMLANFAQSEALAAKAYGAEKEKREKRNADELEAQSDAHKLEFAELEKAHNAELAEIDRANEQAVIKETVARAQALTDTMAHHSKLLGEFEKFKEEQKAIFEQLKEDLLAIEVLKRQGIEEEEAKAIVAMHRATTETAKLFAELDRISKEAGPQAALTWLEGLSKTLELEAHAALTTGLAPYVEYLQGHSPPPKGPLHTIDIGAQRVAQAWSRNLSMELRNQRHYVEDELRAYSTSLGVKPQGTAQQQFAIPSTPANVGQDNARYQGELMDRRALAASADRKPAQINLTIKLGDVTLDGERVGRIVAPVVEQALADGFDVAASVTNAVYTPSVHQSAFRRY